GVLVVLLFIPGGLASVAFKMRDRVLGWLVPGAGVSETAASQPRPEAHPEGVRLALAPALHRQATSARDSASTGLIGGPAPHPIVAHDIVMRFGGLTALSGVSFHAERGEIVGLLGPNGAGKTTLFDVVSGHISPSGGSVLLHGEDMTGLPPGS